MAADERSPIIDGHAHSEGEFCHGEDIVTTMDGLGVDKVILCAGPLNTPIEWWVPNLNRILSKRGLRMYGNRFIRLAAVLGRRRIDLDNGNRHVAELARRHPGRIIQAYWADPSRPEGLTELAAKHEEWRFRAIKLHQCFERCGCDSPVMHELAAFAADKALPIFIHLYARSDARGLAQLAEAHPGTTFVVAHLLGLDEFIRAGPEALPNVHYDISPPNLTSIWLVKRAIAVFGSDHVLLGSDTPYGKDNLSAAVERIRNLDIAEAEKALILGGNARRIYSL